MNAWLLRILQAEIAIIIGFGVLLAYLMNQLQTSKSLAERSQSEWLATDQHAKELEKLRNELPSTGVTTGQSESAIAQLKASLEQAQIAESKLGDIRVLGKTEIPNSRFVREETLVGLKQVTLPDTLALIRSQEKRPGTFCSGITLQTVTGKKDDLELWDVELTLTSLVEQRRGNQSTGK